MSAFRQDPLSVRQAHLARRNLGLVGAAVGRLLGGAVAVYGLPDCMGDGYLALCKAARGWRLGSAAFSRYATRSIVTEVVRAARRWSRHGAGVADCVRRGNRLLAGPEKI